VLLLNLLPTTVHRCTAAPYTLSVLLGARRLQRTRVLVLKFLDSQATSDNERYRSRYVSPSFESNAIRASHHLQPNLTLGWLLKAMLQYESGVESLRKCIISAATVEFVTR
jgi:hypothetical protein